MPSCRRMYFATEVENRKNVRSFALASPKRSASTNGDSSARCARSVRSPRAGTGDTAGDENAVTATTTYTTTNFFTTCFSFGGAVRYSQSTTARNHMDRRRLEQIEQYVLGFFQTAGRSRIPEIGRAHV